MFVPTMLTDAPGLKAELRVWDAVTEAFNEKKVTAIHHYPMFFNNNSGRREIDILIIDELLGICVIEVKGLRIEQIDAIHGPVWRYKNFYEEQGNPFEQAENQLHMLCKHLETDPLLYGRLTKRAFIALPYISAQEWKEQAYHDQINVPLPLFKEDFQNADSLKKRLQTFTLSKSNGSLKELELKRINQALGIKNTDTKQIALKQRLPFSQLYILRDTADFKKYKSDIIAALENGTKVYILAYVLLHPLKSDEWLEYRKCLQLNVYTAASPVRKQIDSVRLTDGENVTDQLLAEMSAHFPDFNSGQFKAIHQPLDAHQIITAGAGTGKTHVMIDRILFLLMNGGISLNLITMITFTNSSTNEMQRRLEKKFIDLFNLTKHSQFLQFAEEVKDMQISTIHSFARSILKQLAHEIGYGQDIQLRSFKFEKQQIIYKLLDEFFSSRSVDLFLATQLKDYEFAEFIHSVWEETEKKGLTGYEIQQIDWGSVSNDKESVIADILAYVFAHCEDRLENIKRTENAVTMGDLIRKLKFFTGSRDRMKQLPKNHFIFVDEFQDSDSVQIELLASLQEFLGYHLFVVGDIKQAIYRFRGADYKSFEELQVKTGKTGYIKTGLQLNYRSSGSLLNKMHPLFENWNKRGWLSYETGDRLHSNRKTQFPDKDWYVTRDFKDDFDRALATLPEEKAKIAFIVRTNRQAKQVKEHCEAKGILTSENLDGTFFISQSVLHFKAMVEGLLYADEARFLINALQSPYFGYSIPYHLLIPFEGHNERIISFIQSRITDGFTKYTDMLRTLAPMTVIQKIIFDNRLFERLSQYMEQQMKTENGGKSLSEEQVDLAVRRYRTNLQHLMILIERNFAAQNLTLQTLCDWLQLQIDTNRTENEPVLNQDKAKVEITTVHRSKGLEYHTVFLPFTSSPFDAVEQNYFLEEAVEHTEDPVHRKFGWRIKVKEGNFGTVYKNSHFCTLKQYEDQEQLKEEARLLYVAMTRAEQRIYITMPERRKISKECWASVLAAGGLLDGLEGF